MVPMLGNFRNVIHTTYLNNNVSATYNMCIIKNLH